MNKTVFEGLTFAGSIAVDSGQAMIGDPCYLDNWDTNKNDEWNTEGKLNQYSYQGASATTIEGNYGELGDASAVVFSTGYGDGLYPVYVKLNDDGRVVMAVIDFNDELGETE